MMRKRILALLLCLILTATVCAVPAFAENTVTVEEAVQSILNDMSNTDDSCTNASQQAANGAYSRRLQPGRDAPSRRHDEGGERTAVRYAQQHP